MIHKRDGRGLSWRVGLRTCAALAMVLVTGGRVIAGDMPRLDDALGRVQATSGFRAHSVEAMARSRAAFAALFDGQKSEAQPVLGDLGFETLAVAVDGGTAHAVADPPDDVQGRGFYTIRPNAWSAPPVLLQAPHRFKDLDTGAIAAELFMAGPFRAGAWNTVPRWAPDDRSDRRSDLAHIDVSYFNAFTRAFAERHPDGVVVQIHGFAKHHRKTAAGRSADVIVSNGTSQLTGPARAVWDCLKARLPGTVRGYGIDVAELGATTNHNAAMLREIGFDRFVHVELARELRRTLLRDSGLRAKLRGCLLQGAE